MPLAHITILAVIAAAVTAAPAAAAGGIGALHIGQHAA